MNHRHRKILHSLFSHPLPSNVHLHDAETVLREMGAEVDHNAHGRLSAKFNGQAVTLHGADHGLSKDEVVKLRKFIDAAGVEPARDYPV